MIVTAILGVSVYCLLVSADSLDEHKRQAPEVLTPVEFHAAFVRAQVRAYILDVEEKKIMILRGQGRQRHQAWVSIDELSAVKGTRLAEKVVPLRMVLIVASFPYKKQAEAFERALGFETKSAAQATMRFRGFNVERRELAANGKPAGPWEKLDIENPAKILMKMTGKRKSAEPPGLKAALVPGLAMALPLQFDEREYPRPEKKLRLLAAALRAADTRGPEGNKLPEHCLARFYDVMVEPGKTYAYRLQVRMADPHAKNAKTAVGAEPAQEERISSTWVEVPAAVTTPSDFSFYAVDQKELDPRRFPESKSASAPEVAVQLHRWVDLLVPPNARGAEPVGDWAIAERVLIQPGEYIGGEQKVELPIWSWFDEEFILARNPEDERDKRVLVPLTEENEIAPVLVEFEGGAVAFNGVKERVPRELLVLMPNGRLIVRNSAADTRDPERLEHYRQWRNRLEAIKSGVAKPK